MCIWEAWGGGGGRGVGVEFICCTENGDIVDES